MNNPQMLDWLIRKAKKGGYVHNVFIPIVMDKILYRAHYAVLLSKPFLFALFGEEVMGNGQPAIEYHAHKMIDIILKDGNIINYLFKVLGGNTNESE